MIKDRNWTKTITYIIKEIVEETIKERLNLWRVPTLKIIKYNLLKRG